MTDLAHHALLSKPALKAVFAALEAVQKDCVRLVGGCVRDALLRRPITDIDLATKLLPDQVIAACTTTGIRTIPTGLAHGTVTAFVGDAKFEITTLRRDVQTDGRHAIVAFTDDWAEDAARRDFHCNALYCDAAGVVLDPTGQGLTDVKAGRVVFVGDAATRIEEDALRILRFFRFSAWYGKGPLDSEGLTACVSGADRIANLSVERIWSELKKLLSAPDPRAVLRAMAQSGVLRAVLPEAIGLVVFERLLEIETSQFLEPDPMQRLMALLPRDPAMVEQLATRLKLSNAEADRLRSWAKDETKFVSYLSAREVRAALYWLGHDLYLDRVRLAWASDAEPKRNSQWRAMIALSSGFVAPTFPLNGDQVLAAGARPGPLIGQILSEVERWWVENDFIEDEFSLFERLKAVTQALG